MCGNLLLADGTDSVALPHDEEGPCAGHRGILFAFSLFIYFIDLFLIFGDLGFFVFQPFLQLLVSGIAHRRRRRRPCHEL
jgi:hypothetical protein